MTNPDLANPELCLDWLEAGGNATVPAPVLCIVLLTYERTEFALRTIDGVVNYLGYPKERLTWYLADDGSRPQHVEAIVGHMSMLGQNIFKMHSQKFGKEPAYCGIGWNKALLAAHTVTDYVLWLEDDWELRAPLNVRPYVRLLMDREDVGSVSMRTMSINNFCETEAHNGLHYLKYLKNGYMQYSGHPQIRHKRFYDAYGGFAPDRTPGDLEIRMDEMYREKPGPFIWRPVDIGGWGVWGHIGRERTW